MFDSIAGGVIRKGPIPNGNHMDSHIGRKVNPSTLGILVNGKRYGRSSMEASSPKSLVSKSVQDALSRGGDNSTVVAAKARSLYASSVREMRSQGMALGSDWNTPSVGVFLSEIKRVGAYQSPTPPSQKKKAAKSKSTKAASSSKPKAPRKKNPKESTMRTPNLTKQENFSSPDKLIAASIAQAKREGGKSAIGIAAKARSIYKKWLTEARIKGYSGLTSKFDTPLGGMKAFYEKSSKAKKAAPKGKKASAKKSSTKKAAPKGKKASAPKKAAPKKSSTKKAAPKGKVADKKAAPKKSSSKKASTKGKKSSSKILSGDFFIAPDISLPSGKRLSERELKSLAAQGLLSKSALKRCNFQSERPRMREFLTDKQQGFYDGMMEKINRKKGDAAKLYKKDIVKVANESTNPDVKKAAEAIITDRYSAPRKKNGKRKKNAANLSMGQAMVSGDVGQIVKHVAAGAAGYSALSILKYIEAKTGKDKGGEALSRWFANKFHKDDMSKGRAWSASVMGAALIAASFWMKKQLGVYQESFITGVGIRIAREVLGAMIKDKETRAVVGLPALAGYEIWSPQMSGYENWSPQMSGYENWSPQMSGYENWSPQMSGYENWSPQLSGGSDIGYQLDGADVGYEMSGGADVGYELSGNPFGQPF